MVGNDLIRAGMEKEGNGKCQAASGLRVDPTPAESLGAPGSVSWSSFGGGRYKVSLCSPDWNSKAFTCLSLLSAGIKGVIVFNLSSFFFPYSPVVPEDSKFLASEPRLMLGPYPPVCSLPP